MAIPSRYYRNQPPPTYLYLDEIVNILGDTKRAFYPFLTAFGTAVFPYGAGNGGIVGLPNDAALEAEYDPIALVGGVQAYYFDSAADNHIGFSDDAVYSHGDGSTDTPFSLGAWIYMTEALGSVRAVLAKYGVTTGQEEYEFRVDASGNLELALQDLSASATETGVGSGDVIVPWTWNFVVATYDGAQAAPDIHLYRNASDTLAAGITTETGSYTAMEDGTAPFMIGARNTLAAPEREFEGWIWGPFITGKELTQANVSGLYTIGQELIGLA